MAFNQFRHKSPLNNYSTDGALCTCLICIQKKLA